MNSLSSISECGGGGGADSTSRNSRNFGRGGFDGAVAAACGEDRRAGAAGCSAASPATVKARAISSAIKRAARISATSWTRTRCAPAITAAVIAAAVENRAAISLASLSLSLSAVAAVKKDFRDGPTRMGYSNLAKSARRARISVFCSLRLPKPRPGSITMESRSTPERRARLMEASRSLVMASITSGIGPSLPQVSGVPRIWLRIRPASF